MQWFSGRFRQYDVWSWDWCCLSNTKNVGFIVQISQLQYQYVQIIKIYICMLGFCSDCCVPQEYQQPKGTTYPKQPQEPLLKTRSSLVSPNPNQNPHVKSNPPISVKKSIQQIQLVTAPNSPRKFIQKHVPPVVVPVQGQITFIRNDSRIQNERIRILQLQNREYENIIRNELVPLKRDYDFLRRQYHNKLNIVKSMNLRLQQIQKMYCSNQSVYSSGARR